LVAVYYSFVTLATLGYGDYLPRTDLARGLAQFEVIGGQLFLAVMVARLIGLFAPSKGWPFLGGWKRGGVFGAAGYGTLEPFAEQEVSDGKQDGADKQADQAI